MVEYFTFVSFRGIYIAGRIGASLMIGRGDVRCEVKRSEVYVDAQSEWG